MRRVLNILVVLGLVWSAYWYGAGYLLRQGVSAWFTEQVARGWQADYSEIYTSGYPLRHITTLISPALADPATGAAWQAEWLNMDSPAIWPGRQTLAFPETAQRLSYFDQTVTLHAQGMDADLHLRPGPDLVVERMALTSGPWAVEDARGEAMAADGLVLAMQGTDQPETYRFNVDAPQFVPGAALRKMLRPTAALPESFESFELDMTVRFDRPWDRRALEDRRPQPVAIDLGLAQAKWGALALFAAGQVTVDSNGVPSGELSIKAENWRDMLALAQGSGAVPDYAIGPAERVLNLLSNMSGNPDTLDVKLGLRDGMVTLGPFPLGPAPYLYLR
ncbi:DUF2125 domain-containing protein [Microbulbifer sp. S227A]|uniref:DUF2125 domain-containing protein n=1 Tax=Microbulbifer sp. S227A TaxID=3415131 RepID=UPI003C7B6432